MSEWEILSPDSCLPDEKMSETCEQIGNQHVSVTVSIPLPNVPKGMGSLVSSGSDGKPSEVPIDCSKIGAVDWLNGRLMNGCDLPLTEAPLVTVNEETAAAAALLVYGKEGTATGANPLGPTVDPKINTEDQWEEKASTDADSFTSGLVPRAPLALEDYDASGTNGLLELTVDPKINHEDQATPVTENELTAAGAVLSVGRKGGGAATAAPHVPTVDRPINGGDRWEEKTSADVDILTSSLVTEVPHVLDESNVASANRPLDVTIDLEITGEDQAAEKVPQLLVGAAASVAIPVISSASDAGAARSLDAEAQTSQALTIRALGAEVQAQTRPARAARAQAELAVVQTKVTLAKPTPPKAVRVKADKVQQISAKVARAQRRAQVVSAKAIQAQEGTA